jgi:hypothetical protein
MGTISMYYVTNPDGVVTNIESLINRTPHRHETVKVTHITGHRTPLTSQDIELRQHTVDTREQVRDILE